MVQNLSDECRKLAEQNFIPLVDYVPDDEPLNLSNEDHLLFVINYAKEKAADLIVIDTVSAAFDLLDENSNAEVKRYVMRPLKRLAREANAAVVFCHHTSKPHESHTGDRKSTR